MRFSASVMLSRKNPVTGQARYMPNVKFDPFGLDTMQFGLTIIDDADWSLSNSEEKARLLRCLGIRTSAPIVAIGWRTVSERARPSRLRKVRMSQGRELCGK